MCLPTWDRVSLSFVDMRCHLDDILDKRHASGDCACMITDYLVNFCHAKITWTNTLQLCHGFYLRCYTRMGLEGEIVLIGDPEHSYHWWVDLFSMDCFPSPIDYSVFCHDYDHESRSRTFMFESLHRLLVWWRKCCAPSRVDAISCPSQPLIHAFRSFSRDVFCATAGGCRWGFCG